MTEHPTPPAHTHHVLNLLAPQLASELDQFRMRLSVISAGYPVVTDWHPVLPEGWGQFPPAPVERATVYRGSAETWAYSHHQAISRFGDRYIAAWSNGFAHEDYVGQEVHGAWSADGLRWSEPFVIAPTPVESGLMRHNAGLYGADGQLYCYVGVAQDLGREAAPPGMFSLSEPRIYLDVYETRDLERWTHHERVCEHIDLYEGPRRTRGGKLLCCGFDVRDHHAMALIWDDPTTLAAPPRVVDVPISAEGLRPEQGTWYQTDDGRIWMYQRESTQDCRLALTWSDDEGETWSDLVRTDFPNTYSRAFAGRLADGRCYIVGNNYGIFLERRHLLIALSNDGITFDRQYTLVAGDTTRRVNGRHKEDGYHYPNCLADGDHLYIIFSVNKEDIEVLRLDTGGIR
jgi:hypothetical protein